MPKKILIQYQLNEKTFEFEVGKLVSIQHPYKSDKLLPAQFLMWVNRLAEKGLIFHGEYDGRCIFRVDGIVLEQLKNEISLDIDSKYEYTGGDPLYKTYSSLSLYLDGNVISQVSMP